MRLFFRVSVTLAVFSVSTGTVHADERPLIWAPTKNSDSSYAVKLGLRLPSELDSEAGINLGLDASEVGAVVNTPVRVWGKLTATSIQTPAYQMKRDIRLNMDAVAGSGLAAVNFSEKLIATERLDVEVNRSYGLRYGGEVSHWRGEASQSVRLSRAGGATAVILQARTLDTFKELSGGISVEQKIGQRLSLNGSIEQSTALEQPTSNVSARYTFKW